MERDVFQAADLLPSDHTSTICFFLHQIAQASTGSSTSLRTSSLEAGARDPAGTTVASPVATSETRRHSLYLDINIAVIAHL